MTSIDRNHDPINVELETLTGMINDPECEFRNVLNQVYKVMMVLHRMGCRENKTYAMNKELEMRVEVLNVKKTYNSYASLTITIISGGLTILGGAVGIFGAFPGTIAGDKLAALAPRILGFFSNAAAAKKISDVGQAIGSAGQGTGIFSRIFDNRSEAARAVHQFALQSKQRRHEESNRAGSEESSLTRDAVRNAQQADYEAHKAIQSVLGQTTS